MTSVQAAPPAESAHAPSPSLQLIYDTAPIGLAFLSPDCRYLQINQHLTEICGISVEGHLGRTVRECVPGLADAVEAIVASIMETGEPVVGVEVAGQRPDQPIQRYWVTYWHPMFGPDGRIAGINVAAEEITERKRAEAALRASEQQFRTLADSIPQLVWMSRADGSIFWFNLQLADFTAVPVEEIPGKDWIDLLAPESCRERWLEALEKGEDFEVELALNGKDQASRPFLTRVTPLRDASGAVYRWIGAHIDVSEMKRREEHVRFIAAELSHRSKNLLAVVMAIAQQTARQAQDINQYRTQFAGRLTALGQSHDLLVQENWYGAHICDLVNTQLKPFGEIGQGRITVTGPSLTLPPNAVQHLGLAFHELVTNAAKHGALSDGAGRLTVRWAVDEAAETVRILWRESGGPPVSPPERKGFGRVVLEQIVPRALKGASTLDYAPDGVIWTFEFPAQECEIPPEARSIEFR